ncbi:MAG: hypothetical protein IK065_05885 [Neisseriaceae bacterium]|nr:hypothetical protein [Neisseriaceae bacterium]
MKNILLYFALLTSVALCSCSRNTDACCVQQAQNATDTQTVQANSATENSQENKVLANLADMLLLYEEEDGDSAISKYALIDIDKDGQDEIWITSHDERDGAVFSLIGEKPILLASQIGRLSPSFASGVLSMSGATGGPTYYTGLITIKNSLPEHTLSISNVYDDYSYYLDDKEISESEAKQFQSTLPQDFSQTVTLIELPIGNEQGDEIDKQLFELNKIKHEWLQTLPTDAKNNTLIQQATTINENLKSKLDTMSVVQKNAFYTIKPVDNWKNP